MPEQKQVLLSVLIPAWNAERYLAEAIRSVLDQGWSPIEIIVVDDGSADGSAAIAEGFGPLVRCLRQPQAGTPAARNAALAAASGDFIAHFDADDIMLPGSIALQMGAFTEDPSLEIVIGHFKNFFSPELDEADRARIALPTRPQRGGLPGTSIVRTDVFHRIGPFNTSWLLGTEIDWLQRAKEAGVRMRILPDVLLRRRIHGRNSSLTMKERHGDRLRVLRASLARRRSAAKT